MNSSILTGLLYNAAILLSFSMLYDSVWMKLGLRKNTLTKLIIGTIIGGIGIVLMLTPWTYVPGITFDTRSVMLSMSGLFFGFIPTLVAMVITAIFRVYLGGGGMLMGIAVIITSGTLGILWRNLRPVWKKKLPALELLVLGFIVHLVMLACTILLPADIILNTVNATIFSVLVVYPLVTVTFGLLMMRQFNNWKNLTVKEELKESERRLSEILKSSHLATVMVDKDFKITFCNEYFLNITGYSNEEVIGKDYLETFIPANIRTKVNYMLVCFIDGINTYRTHENRLMTKDGIELIIAWEIDRLIDSKGNITGISGIGMNITTQRNYELSLLERNEIIARQNEDYRQLTNELQRSKILAEESNRLKSAFLANMSHEIRTPMSGVLGFAELLKEHDLSGDQQKKYISLIEKSGNRLLGIINDLIDISKIESGQMEVHLSHVNIRQLVDDIAEFFRPEIEHKGLHLSVSHYLRNEDIFDVVTDKDKIVAILTNLIKNAIKYSNHGQVETCYRIDGPEIIFSVKDQGVGISETEKNAVFERFVQANVPHSGYKKHEGAGLGLAISKAYVEMLGGKIWVESVKDVGSTFNFTIPIDKNSDNTNKNQNTLETHNSIQLNGLKILIAEDEEMIDAYITMVVKKYCKEVLHAQTGVEAVDICKNNNDIDFILMDLRMPHMDGYEATMKIREFNKNVIIIAQTAFALTGDREKAMAVGCSDYITKPINGAKLIDLLSKWKNKS